MSTFPNEVRKLIKSRKKEPNRFIQQWKNYRDSSFRFYSLRMTEKVSKERRDSSFRFAPFGMTDERDFGVMMGRLSRPIITLPQKPPVIPNEVRKLKVTGIKK